MNPVDVLISFSVVIFFVAFCAFFVYSVKKHEKTIGLPLEDKDYESLNLKILIDS